MIALHSAPSPGQTPPLLHLFASAVPPLPLLLNPLLLLGMESLRTSSYLDEAKLEVGSSKLAWER